MDRPFSKALPTVPRLLPLVYGTCHNGITMCEDSVPPEKAAMLTNKLSKHGNSLARVIDRPILELLGIDEGTDVDISTDGRVWWWCRRTTSGGASDSNGCLDRVLPQDGKALKRGAEKRRGAGVSDDRRDRCHPSGSDCTLRRIGRRGATGAGRDR